MPRSTRVIRFSLALLMSSLLAGGLVACSSSSDDSDNQTGETAESEPANAVVMKLIKFMPETVEIVAGTEVTWTQTDAGTHTVTSGKVVQGSSGVTTEPDGKFESGELATDKTFSFTFDTPGTYTYFCKIHPATMRGEVRVG